MVKAMYKERTKSGINPLLSTVVWAVVEYAFYILWGICEILFEFTFSVGVFAICLLTTVVYGWFLINKILTEYEFEITKDEFTVTSILSKKSKVLVREKLCNIQNICQDKKDTPARVNMKIKRPLQKGYTAYITFKSTKKPMCIQIKAGKKLIDTLKKGSLEK